jgi:hypothetical protein
MKICSCGIDGVMVVVFGSIDPKLDGRDLVGCMSFDGSFNDNTEGTTWVGVS